MTIQTNHASDTLTPSSGTVTVSGTLSGTSVIANTVAVSDTSTNANFYPTLVSSTGSNQALNTTSTALKFNPSTGALTASQLIIAP
jgi:hypothetical protein